MKRALRVRRMRRGQMAVGALIIGIPASVGAVSAGQALAQPATAQPAYSSSLAARVKSRRIDYGQDVVVDGSAPTSDAGHQLQLEYAGAGSTAWSELSSSTVAPSGRFHLAGPLKRSGLVRVVDMSSSDGTPTASATTASATTASAASSATSSVSVAAKLHVPSQPMHDLGGQTVNIHGSLLPGLAGRKVRLEARSGSGWHLLTTARTASGGHFVLHYTPSGIGSQQLRVRFAGDRVNRRTGAPAGELTVFQQTVVSWYNDAGSTACGFHAHFGVANRSLPCGTQVTFLNGGRTVTATVDDRGPYVGGRDWDLNQNTAAALGFGGVGTIWSSL